MKRIAIIIPFYQRERGILRKCVESAMNQKKGSDFTTHLFIVDDGSPISARGELAGLESDARCTVQVIERGNGGPGAARNTGLDSVQRDTDFVAFLDSDDIWLEDHLQRAIGALGDCGDLYFSDHTRLLEKDSHFQSLSFWQTFLMKRDQSFFPTPNVPDTWYCESDRLLESIFNEYLAHTSSIVYRYREFSGLRFDTSLRSAGEDVMFTIELLLRAGRIMFSTQAEVELGHGVNVFASAACWDSPENLFRCFYNLSLFRKLEARTEIDDKYKATLHRQVSSRRRSLSYLLARYAIKSRTVPSRLITEVAKHDPIFFLQFPINVALVAGRRLFGPVSFDV
jgi:succinoglycan biosynthesis protein ExoW